MADENEKLDENEKAVEEEPTFEVGETVIVREDFHSKYFQGMRGIISGPARKGGTPQTLWPLKIDVAPYETVMAGKYLRRPTAEELREEEGGASDSSAATGSSGAQRSLLSRLLPWKRK